MSLFNFTPRVVNKDNDVSIAKKSNTQNRSATNTIRGGTLNIITEIKRTVDTKLGEYKNDYCVIRDKEELHRYVDSCIKNNIVAIDTETTGKNPHKDTIVGLSMYTPGEKPCYVPINHISYITNVRVDNQLNEKDIKECLARLEGIEIIMFNAPFDVEILENNCDVHLTCTWDCYLGARCLNENEEENALKKLHQKYILKNEKEESKFKELFSGLNFNVIPIDTAYVYAAHDAIITYEYYEFQKKYLNREQERDDLLKVSEVFLDMEMPLEPFVIEMEQTGVDFDREYCNELLKKYEPILRQKEAECYKELEVYSKDIEMYRKTHVGAKIDLKINLSSPPQLATLLYDIIKVGVIDPKKPRGTGAKIIKQINIPFTNKLLEYRECYKLVNTYIAKMPNWVNPKTGRIHGKFNQYGTDTGRFSASDPNLQNIPSKNHDIRKMFKATNGYVMMSSDFSQQEPKCLAALCKMDGDSQMYDAFMAGKDIYSEIASKSFHKPYEECCEFAPDGSKNPDEYKLRRTKAKSILLGVLYGRGEASIAEQLGCSVEEAHEIKESVFRGFPAIKKFEQESIAMATNKGYVTTITGRKRRLPKMMLPDYEVRWATKRTSKDPLDFDNDESEVPWEVQEKWLRKIYATKYKKGVYEEANKAGLWIVDNTKDKDVTKVVNSRIQGSAADLTKLAMIELGRNKHLRELGFRMLIQVHDELIIECPKEHAKECETILAQTMSHAAEEILKMPIKCDVEVTERWYGKEVEFEEETDEETD